MQNHWLSPEPKKLFKHKIKGGEEGYRLMGEGGMQGNESISKTVF